MREDLRSDASPVDLCVHVALDGDALRLFGEHQRLFEPALRDQRVGERGPVAREVAKVTHGTKGVDRLTHLIFRSGMVASVHRDVVRRGETSRHIHTDLSRDPFAVSARSLASPMFPRIASTYARSRAIDDRNRGSTA